jgi:hypothetical protein
MEKEISVMDLFSDDPKYKLINVYNRIPVFKLKLKVLEPGKTNRFWWGAIIKSEKFIILGSDSIRQDLTHALCTMLRFSLKDYLLVSVYGNPAGQLDLKDEQAVDEFLSMGRI